MMEIRKITENKKVYLDLLLLADEQESMIDKYLPQGDMFILLDEDIKTICVVSNNENGIYEIKNLATEPKYQKQGYAKYMIEYICKYYQKHGHTMLVGTANCPSILLFYQNCGFTKSHVVKNFFIDNYNHPMFECGKQLIDMIYLKKSI